MKKKWILICVICALPSFTLALFAGFDSLSQITGMLLGVVTFIVLFSRFEDSGVNRRLLSSQTCSSAKRFSIAAKVTTAMLAFVGCLGAAFQIDELIFLAFIEAYPGFLSIHVVECLWSVLGWQPPYSSVDFQVNLQIRQWIWNHLVFTFLTTLVQGTLLSLVMIAFGILALPVIMALEKSKRRRHS